MSVKTKSKKCPSCGADSAKAEDPRVLPFCSSRCKYVDLGKWFKEEYAIATTATDDEAENALGDTNDRE